MSMVLEKNGKMVSPFLHEFKRQASFFLKEKIKTARLALTDVTPTQLLTEEATSGDFWARAPDTRTMAVISRAAFEVDDYWRIVGILHKRLMKFDRKTWRVSYKSLLVLEHLLTHGPLRVVEEFESDKDVIMEIGSFQFVDDKGFNWGLSVRNLSARILKLLENYPFLKEERGKSRNLSRGIQGFGSFSHRSPTNDGSFEDLVFRSCTICNSNYSDKHNQEYDFLPCHDHFSIKQMLKEPQNLYDDIATSLENSGTIREEECTMEDHPFCYSDHDTKETLLSTI